MKLSIFCGDTRSAVAIQYTMTYWILTLYKHHFRVSNLARYILKRAETIVWPENPHDWGQDSCGGKAIHRFGFTSQIASLATRLKLQRQVETVDAVYNYIKMSATKDKLRLNVVSITTFNDITLPLVPGPSAEQRFKSYKIIYKRRSME